MRFPKIKTQRLLLREIKESDIPYVFDVFSRHEVTEHYDCYPFIDKSQAKKWVDWQIGLYDENGDRGYRWAIATIENPGQLIGSCGFHSVNENSKSFDVGYELHPDFWGKGYASEALKAIITHCFANDFPFKVNRITATTDVVSPKSISVLSKLGFKEEGILREYGYWKDRFNDVRLFSLLRKEWALNKELWV